MVNTLAQFFFSLSNISCVSAESSFSLMCLFAVIGEKEEADRDWKQEEAAGRRPKATAASQGTQSTYSRWF